MRSGGIEHWGSDWIDLGRSEPLAAWPRDPAPVEGWWRATQKYSRVGGDDSARTAIAEIYSARVAHPLSKRNIAILPGGLATVTVALAALISPGDEVIVPTPCFQHHPAQIESVGGLLRPIDTRPTEWRLTPELLRKAVGPKTRALLLSNPANPTGVGYSQRELDSFVMELGSDIAIIADEVYAEFAYHDNIASVGDLAEAKSTTWISVRSASKTLGRPGLRAAIALGPEGVVERVASHAAVSIGAISASAQATLLAGLQSAMDADYMRAYRSRSDRAIERLAMAGFETLKPDGTYYLWIGASTRAAGGMPHQLGTMAGAADLAARHGVQVLPGTYFGGPPTHARISLSLPRSSLEAGIERVITATYGNPE